MTLPDQHLFTLQETGNILFGQPIDGQDKKYVRRVRRLVKNKLLIAIKDGTKMYINRQTLQRLLSENNEG
mgnify:FL=1|tara:strand:- start:2627 stop:2836 length:210 start_codon:yes stop_codon:yes gene_type:complete